ncbi:hypothetical protein FHS18_002325 [Paenibacillus phyllosphaerae]|uniref:Uncharacterized protein n=1 Tax=Paenibacillus phyllosphaerae TaxID=274593 RepID=A0A7W5AWY1_9BACL|nr:hypothetical protein [Paenibacillus phyllosphaerae]MBB3110258.1 hypothetical protein [Paenibacillus phyllosphaerae]
MSEFPENYSMQEGLSGKWYKLGFGVRGGTMLIEMGETVLLSVHVSSMRLDLLLKDEQGIYQYAGDFSFENLEREGKLLFHSWAIEHLHMNNHDLIIDNPTHEMTNLFIKLSLDKRKQAEDKFLNS